MAKPRTQLQSKSNKNDEFFTLWDDIAAELPLYKDHFKDKRIICPCDWDESYNEECIYQEDIIVESSNFIDKGGSIKQIDIANSRKIVEKDLNLIRCNFVKFLVAHADSYGIRSISASGYNPTTGVGVRFQDIDYSKYDIVITNPPFSVFREFVDTMFESRKKFLVIGPTHALTYQGTFRHIQNNEMWLGYHHHMTGFLLADGQVLPKNDPLVRYCCWYTNLDVAYRHDKMILTEKYDPEKNPGYCNYEGIEVRKTSEIPDNYSGNMGVPITFLQKYNPDQFEILGISDFLRGGTPSDVPKAQKSGNRFYIKRPDGLYKCMYQRIVIRNKEVTQDDN